MFNRSFVTRLAVFALLLAFTAGCAAQPVPSSAVDKLGAAAPAASGLGSAAGAPSSQASTTSGGGITVVGTGTATGAAQPVPSSAVDKLGAAAPAASGLASAAGAPSSQASTTSGGGITVVGTGTATGAPDQANVSIGVQTQSATVKQAVSDNQTQMNTLLAALKSLSIADKDIGTSNYSVYTENQPVQTGADGKSTSGSGSMIYHVSNQVDVTVRDVSKLGDLLDKAVTSGANNIYGVSFSVADPSKLEDQARAAAVKDAKARAESLASLEGITLSGVISISEVSAFPGPMYNAAKGQAGGGTPIQPGEMNISVSLTVTYSIK